MDNFLLFLNKTKLGKLLIIFLFMLTLFLAVQTINAFKSYYYIGNNMFPSSTITVNGEGEVFAIPDVATISFAVTEQAKEVKNAQSILTAKIDKTITALKELGIPDRDIKTVNYNIYPKYEYTNQSCAAYDCPPSRQIIVGYEVRQAITVKIRKIDDAGSALRILGEQGASDISELNFAIDDERKLIAEARGKAITDAREQAGALAKNLKVRLVRVLNFSESGNYPISIYERGEMDTDYTGGGPEIPYIPVGENSIVSNVSITYEIR